MAEMKPYAISYKGSVTPAATKFLTSQAVVMDFAGTIALDATDAANTGNLQKAFQSEMDARIKAQLGFLNKWLARRTRPSCRW
jgi:hypothetical protein